MAKKSGKKTTVDEDVEPWERQPDESSEAFGAWVVYRDMVGKRSCARVAQELTLAPALIRRWSADWRWVDRYRRWENHKDALARAAVLQEIVAFRRRAARQSMAKAQTVMLADMALTQRLGELGNNPSELLKNFSVEELYGMALRGASALPNLLRAEALALGDSTDRTEVAAQKDTLSSQIAARPDLLARAAALIEEASLGAED